MELWGLVSECSASTVRTPSFCRPHARARVAARRFVSAPVLTSVFPDNIAPTGGVSVTVSGLNFNANDPTATTSLELSVACSSASWTSGTTVQCGAASYRGGTAQIGVSVSGIVGTGVGGSFGSLSFDGAHARNASACRMRQE